MAASKTAKPPVIKKGKDIIADEPEVVLEKVEEISKEDQTMALATIRPTDLSHLVDIEKQVDEWEKKYKDLRIKDENDTENYDKVVEALRITRPKRGELNDERKAGNSAYSLVIKYRNSRYGTIINRINALEAPWKEDKKRIDDLEKEKKEQEKIDKANKVAARVDALTKNGAAFDGAYYSIKDEALGISEIALGMVDIEAMSDELFKNFLQQVIDKNETIKSETERIQKEKEEAYLFQQKQEEEARKKLAEEQEALRKEREAMDKEKLEMQLERDRIEKEKLEQENQKINEMKARDKARFDARADQLFALGMKFHGQYMAYVYEDVNIDVNTELNLWSDDEWNKKIEEITPVIAQRKEAAAKKIEEDRKAEEKRIADKAIADKLEADRQEQERKALELAAANDKTKWKNVIEQLQAVKIPEMTTQAGIKKANALKEYIANL